MKHVSDGDINCSLSVETKNLTERLEELEIRKKNQYYPVYNIVEIDKNTPKSPKDLQRHALTETAVKDHQLSQLWKTRSE